MILQEDYLDYNNLDDLNIDSINLNFDDFAIQEDNPFMDLQDNDLLKENLEEDLKDLESITTDTYNDSNDDINNEPQFTDSNINIEDFLDTQKDSFDVLYTAQNDNLLDIEQNKELNDLESFYSQNDDSSEEEETNEQCEDNILQNIQENVEIDDIIKNAEIPEVSEIPEVIKEKPPQRQPIKVEACVIDTKESAKKSCFRDYNVKTDTVGYQLRGNKHTLPVSHKLYRFKLVFTNVDNTKYVPASINSSINALQKCSPNQEPINPFGEILFYNSLNVVDAGKYPSTDSLWTQCSVQLGYSFNINGEKLNLSKWKPLYIKCIPQQDGTAIIDNTIPYTQTLPTNNDGKIYIYLGIVYDDDKFELDNNHLIYYNDGTGIRVWTGKDCYTKIEVDSVLKNKQDILISGKNIKTINNESLLGNGNIDIEGTEEIDLDEIKELWKQYITHN